MASDLGSELHHLWRKLSGQRRRAQRSAKAAFWEAVAQLGPGQIAIDLGANAGEFTVPLARTGAEVHAFEPDPHALTNLRAAIAPFENVTLHAAAVGTEAGTAALYRSGRFERDPDRGSKSSSLLADKRNVDKGAALEIKVVDFIAFLQGLNRPVALIKMDIEGAEVALLEALLAAPLRAQLGQIFVETHERALPALAPRIAALKAGHQPNTAPVINWDWH